MPQRIYGEDIAELREDYASRAQQLEEKYREKERATAQSLVDAWEARRCGTCSR